MLSPFLILPLILLNSCTERSNGDDSKEILEKILTNLDEIETAHYVSTASAYNIYDTIKPVYLSDHYFKEYTNPSDTFVGASFIRLSYQDSSKMEYSYDGFMRSRVNWEEGYMEIDSFKTMRFPWREVGTPFFTRAKIIFNYLLETEDSISYSVKHFMDSLKINLTIYDTINSVDFIFGNNPIYTPQNAQFFDPGFSNYDIWVTTSDYLPFKIKRDLPHSISIESIKKIDLNIDNISNFSAKSYFPDLPFPDKTKKLDKLNLLGEKAPSWSLKQTDNQLVHLRDFKGKVILLEFTGIGCGPCYAAVPFLKQLTEEYNKNFFEVVSIESWVSNVETIKNYQNKNALNYTLLRSNELVEQMYQVNSVPRFFLIDQNQIVRESFTGFSLGKTNKKNGGIN